MTFPFALVVFDLDGVLVASDACHARAYEELWEKLGVVGAPAYPEMAGRATRDVVGEQLARARAETDLDTAVRFKQERARDLLAAAPIVFEDTGAALARFARAARLAIGTGASRETAELLLKRVAGSARFEVVVAAEDVALGKPAPDVYAQVIARCGVAPDHTLVVEDSAAGVQAGLAAGAHVALVRSAAPASALPRAARVLGAFADLAALADALGLPR